MANNAHDDNDRRAEKFPPGEDDTSSASPRNDSPRSGRDAPDTSGAGRPDNPFAPKPRRAAGELRRPETERARKPLGGRNVAALAVAGIAALCVIAVVVSYVVWALNRDTGAAAAPAPALNATPEPVLAGPQMLSEVMAKEIDPTRSWQQTLDQDGVTDASPQIACIGPQASGQPNPATTHLRGLSASGEDRVAALHRADAYGSVEDAEKVFDFRSAELGTCAGTSLYIQKGMNITGLGDEAVGVQLALQDTKPEYHSVVLVRTGRVVNLLDAARLGEAVDMQSAAKGLTGVINHQCGPAIGLCTAPETSVTAGVPPAGGEQQGLLTAGDIPRVTPGQGNWRGNPPSKRIDIQDGSSCEAVDFASDGGSQVDRTQRTYLLRNDPAAPPAFGIDQVVLKMGSADEAAALADRINKSVAECGTRTLTAQVVKEGAMSAPGANGVEVKGKWFIVNQKVDANRAQKYRVGVVTAGDKVIYLRANPSETFDFTDEAWSSVNQRAGERATQVS